MKCYGLSCTLLNAVRCYGLSFTLLKAMKCSDNYNYGVLINGVVGSILTYFNMICLNLF